MTGRTGSLRSDQARHPRFIRAQPSSKLEDAGDRIAEWLLLIWLTRSDPNILGLRAVDQGESGRPSPIVHLAIPLGYKRKQLAQMLGIDQLADETVTPRINLKASAGWDQPHSYVCVDPDFIVSQMLGATKARVMQPSATGKLAIQAPQGPVQSRFRSGPDLPGENGQLRSVVKQALAMRNVSIERRQIQILTHRGTGDKWVRIIDVDRSSRTTLRLVMQRAGISASVAFGDDIEGSGWSIRFAATEISKLFLQTPDSFDVHSELQIFTERSVKDVDHASPLGTPQMGRGRLIGTTASFPGPQGLPPLSRRPAACVRAASSGVS
jgi:hypothetical protein